jgi:hypothetical protein
VDSGANNSIVDSAAAQKIELMMVPHMANDNNKHALPSIDTNEGIEPMVGLFHKDSTANRINTFLPYVGRAICCNKHTNIIWDRMDQGRFIDNGGNLNKCIVLYHTSTGMVL